MCVCVVRLRVLSTFECVVVVCVHVCVIVCLCLCVSVSAFVCVMCVNRVRVGVLASPRILRQRTV